MSSRSPVRQIVDLPDDILTKIIREILWLSGVKGILTTESVSVRCTYIATFCLPIC